MITKATVEDLTKQLGIPTFGIAPWPLPADAAQVLHTDDPCPFIAGTPEERLTGNTKLTAAKSAIVCLFPYYIPHEGPINLPRYAWGKDYHLVVHEYLDRLGQALQAIAPSVAYEIHCDTSPLADRYMGYLAGLGVFGRNRALINPTWGSYTSIGTLLTNIDLPAATPLTGTCDECNRCRTHCPGQSLNDEDFHYHTCKSYLTQKKGDLTESEIAIIGASPLIFGCDICQEVCPHNQNVPETPIPEFRENLTIHINREDIEPLTNKEFKAAYGHRAYAWRGKKVLLRNLEYTIVKLVEGPLKSR